MDLALINKIKKTILTILSFIIHPILTFELSSKKHKGSYFILGRRIRINKPKLIQLGYNIEICDNARILCIEEYKGQNYKPSVYIGHNVCIGFNFSLLVAEKVTIEDYVLIASNVLISSENHGMDPLLSKSYTDQPLIAKPVHIGMGCWLGEKSMIMPGVTLGKKCIVAAGAVVTKSFPDYCLIAGVPAKCIKKYDLQQRKWLSCE